MDWTAPEGVVIQNHGPAKDWIRLPETTEGWSASHRLFWSQIAVAMGKLDEADYWEKAYQEAEEEYSRRFSCRPPENTRAVASPPLLQKRWARISTLTVHILQPGEG